MRPSPRRPSGEEPAEAQPAWLSGVAQAAAESEEAEFDELKRLRAQSEAALKRTRAPMSPRPNRERFPTG